ncbi:sensor domain-containing diguanylate cyclase [Rhodopseudomonas sp.]|uniref:sensor domain-containing diguanylate cyclase n=1 Tax=Rhodopseudomonas sp. TaxID=1078 RepID=UPI003B3AB140
MAGNYLYELDFIYFFYGLAFIALGTLCFIVARSRPAGGPTVRMIGLFGIVHGIAEWIAMATLLAGDAAEFSALRSALVMASFMLLTEAARRGAIRFRHRAPGRWIYVVGAIVLAAVAYMAGIRTAEILARYSFGLVGALGTSATMFAGRNDYDRAIRPIKIGVAASFAVYGIATAIGPAAWFWPANVVNEAWFANLTGVSIQLIRGATAVVLSLMASVAWGSLLIQSVDSRLYSAYLKRLAVGALATLLIILTLGWNLTSFIGDLFREKIEREAIAETDVLTGRIARETATLDAMVQVLAGQPLVADTLRDANSANTARLQAVLDLNVRASGASLAAIFDSTGSLLGSTERRQLEPLGVPNRQSEPWFAGAVRTGIGHSLDIDSTGARSYVTAYAVRSSSGAVIGVAMMESSLESLATHLRAFDHLFFVIDARGVILVSNRRAELQRTLWPRPELPPQSLSEQFGAPVRPSVLAHEVQGGEWSTVDGRPGYVVRKPIGATGWSLVLSIPTTDIFAGRLLGLVITLQIAVAVLVYFIGRERSVRDRILRLRRVQLHHRARKLAQKASTDALTGVPNRFMFDERLQEEVARSERTNAPFSLVLLDVDRFKAINDAYGHPRGDQVLVQLARTVKANVRQTDLLARWGGEEFVLLLIDTELAGAAEVAEKLRVLIAHTPFEQVGTVTSSFGAAEFRPGDSPSGVLARADQALYRAKLHGRNRVELDGELLANVPLVPDMPQDSPLASNNRKASARG